ncbi:hypothetical protein B0H10DRAFT_715538 [Mycena sp. CBHHK59/15]|nr:hypothetical protein B0H10DRAFT_715538 [Mycena sp. CBHHK59/15]
MYPEPRIVARHHQAVDAHGTGTIWGNGRVRVALSTLPSSIPSFPIVLHPTPFIPPGLVGKLHDTRQPTAIRDFAIPAQPFWCNAVADSRAVVYDGMRCNADPAFAEMKRVTFLPLK